MLHALLLALLRAARGGGGQGVGEGVVF